MWSPIPGFPDYEISFDAEVRSKRYAEVKMLAGTVTDAGYTAFMLRKPGDTKTHRRLLHRLVALTFLENPNSLPDVAHCDGNPANNRVDNLRWATHRDNQMDMRRHGTMQDGEKCITCKLTEEQVLEILSRVATGEKQYRLAEEFDVSKQQVSRIVRGKRWASLRFGREPGT